MPFKITFLEGAKPLTKEITGTKTTNYPLTKNFTSHSYSIDTITTFFKHIQTHAKKGHCLLKGPISKEIKKESRAGSTLSTTPTSWVVIDIDSAEFPCNTSNMDTAELKKLSEQIVKTLPKFLRKNSYIAQASSSLGFIKDKVSLHLFFVLDTPIPPTTLKQWLTNINFTLPYFKDRLELTKTGWDVKYTLDRCVADNTRIIYIAPPNIKTKTNPFANNNDRIILVKKKNLTIESQHIIASASTSTEKEKKETLFKLRKLAGLETRSKAKFQHLLVSGNKTKVLLNPTPGLLTHSYQARGYDYYNFNGGNSNGYYHPIGKPDLIYNFKDEPVFRWIDVDPTGYDAYVATHGLVIAKANPIRNFAIISKQDDILYKIVHNHQTDELRVAPSDITKAAHFYREHGEIMPETIHEWDLVFDPTSLIPINYEQKIINQYIPSSYIQKAVDLKKVPTTASLEKSCPTIYKLLLHILGDGKTEYAHFINWLSFVLQEKEKTNTCWFMWGIPGTGKGLFYNYVLKPIFGKQNIGFHLGSAIEDKYDAWRRDKQLIVIDEFELPHGKKGDQMMEKIKNWTAESDNSIRDMRTIFENIEGIEAYIFFSNKHEMVKVDDEERRFNIAPRQEKKINNCTWFRSKDIVEELTNEIQIFTNFLLSFPIDKFNARQALMNEAKAMAADATKTQADNFCSAIHKQNLDYFIDLLYLTSEDAGTHIDAQLELKSAQIEVRRWLSITHNTPNTRMHITPIQIATVYRAITCAKDMSPPAISKMLSRHGIVTKHTSVQGKKGRFFGFIFDPPSLSKQEIDVLLKAAPGTQVANILKDKTA